MDPINTYAELEQALIAHDWTHMLSDDHRAYMRGREDMRRIENATLRIPGGAALYKRFVDARRAELEVG